MNHIPVSLLPALLASLAFSVDAQRSEQTVLRTEQEIKISIETPAVASNDCEATSAARYEQRNTMARVEGTITVGSCAAPASGEFTLTIRVRDDAGEVKVLEIPETWQRSDDKDVSFSKDYPIGENVELLSARLRGLTCTCAGPAAED